MSFFKRTFLSDQLQGTEPSTARKPTYFDEQIHVGGLRRLTAVSGRDDHVVEARHGCSARRYNTRSLVDDEGSRVDGDFEQGVADVGIVSVVGIARLGSIDGLAVEEVGRSQYDRRELVAAKHRTVVVNVRHNDHYLGCRRLDRSACNKCRLTCTNQHTLKS